MLYCMRCQLKGCQVPFQIISLTTVSSHNQHENLLLNRRITIRFCAVQCACQSQVHPEKQDLATWQRSEPSMFELTIS